MKVFKKIDDYKEYWKKNRTGLLVIYLFQMEQQIRGIGLSDGHGQGYRGESRSRRHAWKKNVSLLIKWTGKSRITQIHEL